MNNVLPFLELPSFTFELVDNEEDEEEHFLEELEADDLYDEEGW